jgi:hypothetical protein
MADHVGTSKTVHFAPDVVYIDTIWPDVNLEEFRVKPITEVPKRRTNVKEVPVVKEYKPTKEEYSAVIDEIANLLPHKSIWPLSKNEDGEKYETDYPTVTREMLLEAGSDRSPITKRPVWIIGNMVFFKRYADEDLVNVGFFKSPDISPHIWWEQGFVLRTWKSLFALRDLIKSRHPSTVTQEEVLKLIDLKIE